MTAGENRALTLILADDGGITRRRYLLGGIVFAGVVTLLELFRGKAQIWVSRIG